MPLFVKGYYSDVWSGGIAYAYLGYQATNIANTPHIGDSNIVIQLGSTQNENASPYPIFVTETDALNFYKDTYCNQLIDAVNSTYGSTIYAHGDYNFDVVDLPVQIDISKLVTKTTMVNGHALSSDINITASDLGLKTVATSGSYTDLTNKPSIPVVPTNLSSFSNDVGYITAANVPAGTIVYNGTAQVSNPKILQKSGSTIAGGTAVFQLTDNNLATGNALLSNIHSVNVDINSSAAAYGYSWALSNSNKTLTVTVVQPGSLLGLGLIPFVSAAAGVAVNVRVFGN